MLHQSANFVKSPNAATNQAITKQIYTTLHSTCNFINPRQCKAASIFDYYLLDPSFQGVNRLFVLSFENGAHRTTYERSFVLTVEIKDYNVLIYGRNVLDPFVKNDIRTYKSIRKVDSGQGDNYTIGCLLDYPYFKENLS